MQKILHVIALLFLGFNTANAMVNNEQSIENHLHLVEQTRQYIALNNHEFKEFLATFVEPLFAKRTIVKTQDEFVSFLDATKCLIASQLNKYLKSTSENKKITIFLSQLIVDLSLFRLVTLQSSILHETLQDDLKNSLVLAQLSMCTCKNISLFDRILFTSERP